MMRGWAGRRADGGRLASRSPPSAAAALSACGSDDAAADGAAASERATTGDTVAPSPRRSPPRRRRRTTPYYVSIGDSYAAGYEAGIGNTDNGFAYQVVDEAAALSHPLELVNFGCGGATTMSMLESVGCSAEGLGPGAAPYDGQTQLEAAETFLRDHPGEVDLITVSIGGNDVTACAATPDPVPCVTAAVEGIETNVSEIAATAAGRRRPGNPDRRHDLPGRDPR